MVDGIAPGGTGANDGYWEEQLRDRFGRFMEMGGNVLFEVTLPGVEGEVQAKGKYIGATDMTTARIEVLDNSEIPKGVYLIKTDKIQNIEAVIPAEYLEDQLGKAKASTKPLKKSMLGSEVQKEKLRTIARNLKAKGRFPVPRQSMNDTMGTTSDVSMAAKADYKKVYDASPELQEKYSSPEELWDRVYKLSVDTDWSSPNELSEIPEEMRLINRQYAKHFLGLEEDGLITVYRNAVNGKNNQIDAAAGYVSTDMSLAYDYNSKKDNIGANGRYEIDVKPDEIFGMLGYSKPEDEFAFVIGKGVTSQEGRVRRVGDLAPLPMPAPWLQQYEKEISYARGETPYRHHALGGQFDFHEVENFGNSLQEFISKYNLTAGDIKSTFDRLYGSGAYEDYRASGNTVTFETIKRMFVDLPNGNIGLDITKIPGGRPGVLTMARYGEGSPDTFANDRTDNTLKMLSVFQELTGEPFYTHRSRDYVPGAEQPIDVAPSASETSAWDGVPFNPEFMEDNGEIAYYMQEPNPPATLYHVAPKTAREDILRSGLDAKDKTWNTGVGISGAEVFRDEHLWTKDDDGNDWAYEYRPTGIYMFNSLDRAREYAGDDRDIYQINTVSNDRDIIRDPSGAINWEYLEEEDRAYVTRYVEPGSLKLLEDSQSITPEKFKEMYNDDKNVQTTESEAKIAKELYDLMLESGLTKDEIASANPSYANFKDTYFKDEEVPLEDVERYGQFIITALSRQWNESAEYSAIKKLQKVAEKLFKPEGVYESIPDPEWLEELKNTKTRQVSEAILAAAYRNTQKYFADNNIKTLVVYRGLRGSVEGLQDLQEGEIGDIGALQGAAMASWALDPKEAGYFANTGIILRSEIPVSSVLSMSFTGLFGVYEEQELVVLGMPRNTKAVKYDRNQKDSADAIIDKLRGLDKNFDTSKPLETKQPPEDIPKYSFENSKTGWKYSDEHVVGIGGKDSPTDEELDAIAAYIGDGYSQMNDVTRGYDPGDDPFFREDIDTYVENLTNLIDRNPSLGTTALVYRGVYDSVGMKWSELEIGDELIDRGFVSTTNSIPTARGFGNIQLEIELGEDTKLIDVSETVEGTRVPVKESEIILQRGTKFEVVAKTENGFRLRVVGSDTSGVIDVVSEEATEERLDPSLQKFSERTVAFTEDGRSQVKVLRIAMELGEDSAYIDWEPSGEIYYIKVPPEYRRQGIATKLWEAAKELARESGLPIPTLSQYRTDEGDAWAKSLGEELPPRIQS